jgi:oxygen-independent coproporphyrinogen III oxidase
MPTFPLVSDELVRRYDVPAPRYTSYPTAPIWTEKIGPAAYAAALERAARRPQAPLSLYAHIPFCKERCAFCGCNVVVTRSRATADRYLGRLMREMDLVQDRLGRRRSLSQIHWGGGTPTFLDERQLEALWQAIEQRFAVLPDAEISIEIDPVVTTRSQLECLRRLGFNRISMGVQDLDPAVQAAIDRVQSVEETGAAVDHARALGFRGINFDLIYGLPLQTKASWERTLAQVLALRPDRLAVYSFAYVPDLRPNQKRLPVSGIPGGKDKLDLFRLAWEALTTAGYRQIGMDHFALPDDELAQAQARRGLGRNFQGYTVQTATEVIAFGVSAISDVGGLYAQNAHGLSRYENSIGEGTLATGRGIALTAEDLVRRALISGLMCNFWVQVPAGFGRELARLAELESEGLLTLRGREVELTALGRIFVRNVAAVFDAYAGRPQQPFSRAI